MASQFSDPAWWPTPPPKAPAGAPIWKIVLGTLVPLGIAVIGGVLIVTRTSHSSHATPANKSIPSFTACLKSHGFAGAEEAPDSSKVQEAEGACADRLPDGTQSGAFLVRPTQAQEKQFSACTRTAVRQPRRVGPFSSGGSVSGYRKSLQRAQAVCAALIAFESSPPATNPPTPQQQPAPAQTPTTTAPNDLPIA
jgi:hypothetical protein